MLQGGEGIITPLATLMPFSSDKVGSLIRKDIFNADLKLHF